MAAAIEVDIDLDSILDLNAPQLQAPDYLYPDEYRDWTENGTYCLTKSVLMAFAAAQHCTDGQLYRKYFESYTLLDAEANLSSLERFDQMAYEHFHQRFYHSHNPSHEPDWISFNSPNDLNRLAQLTGTDFVIYKVKRGRLPRGPLTKHDLMKALYSPLRDSETSCPSGQTLFIDIEVFHDYRCYYTNHTKMRWFLLSSNSSRLYELDSAAVFDRHFSTVSPCKAASSFTAVDLRIQLSSLIDTDDDDDEVGSEESVVHHDHIYVASEEADGLYDYVSAIAVLLEDSAAAASPPLANEDEFLVEAPNLTYKYLSDFWEADEEALYQALGRRKCLIVYMVRRMKQRSAHQRRFVTLAVVAPKLSNTQIFSERILPGESCPVICIYNERFLYALPEAEAKEVLQTHFDTSGQKERLLNRNIWLEGVEKKLPSAVLEEALKKQESKRKRKRQKRTLPVKLCRCRLCSRDKRYTKNMDSHGPERLCSTKHTIPELLEMLNYPDTLNVQHCLDLMSELSIAAMDIESRTCQLDMKGPKPGPTVEYGEVDAAVLEGHVKKIQRPVMIAHTDFCVNEKDGTAWSLTVQDNTTDSIFAMMKNYWTKVLDCRAECVRRKEELAQPILDYLKRYREAFDAFYDGFVQFELEDIRSRRDRELEQLSVEHARSQHSDFVVRTTTDAVKQRYQQLEDILPLTEAGLVSETCKRQAWQASIPGKIEVQLRRLVHSYTIFTFCGYIMRFFPSFYYLFFYAHLIRFFYTRFLFLVLATITSYWSNIWCPCCTRPSKIPSWKRKATRCL